MGAASRVLASVPPPYGPPGASSLGPARSGGMPTRAAPPPSPSRTRTARPAPPARPAAPVVYRRPFRCRSRRPASRQRASADRARSEPVCRAAYILLAGVRLRLDLSRRLGPDDSGGSRTMASDDRPPLRLDGHGRRWEFVDRAVADFSGQNPAGTRRRSERVGASYGPTEQATRCLPPSRSWSTRRSTRSGKRPPTETRRFWLGRQTDGVDRPAP
jgi:hypothetical protein